MKINAYKMKTQSLEMGFMGSLEIDLSGKSFIHSGWNSGKSRKGAMENDISHKNQD